MRPAAVHANCLVLGPVGLLIRGDAGSGKTSLADTLIEAARARGHLGITVADDYVHLIVRGSRLLAQVPEPLRGRMEIRGFGLVPVEHLPEAHVRLVVDLVPPERIERLPEVTLAEVTLEGVRLPLATCPENDGPRALRLIRWALRELLPQSPDYL